MIIGSISENKELEKRISITPDIAKKYISNGFEVFLEKNFGSHLGISDDEFVKEGCKIDQKENILKKSDIILKVNFPSSNEVNLIKNKSILIAQFDPNLSKDLINQLVKNEVKIFSLNLFAFPASNKKPVFSLIIVSLDPPMLLAIIGFSIDCASTETLPNDSGSIEAEITTSEIS